MIYYSYINLFFHWPKYISLVQRRSVVWLEETAWIGPWVPTPTIRGLPADNKASYRGCFASPLIRVSVSKSGDPRSNLGPAKDFLTMTLADASLQALSIEMLQQGRTRGQHNGIWLGVISGVFEKVLRWRSTLTVLTCSATRLHIMWTKRKNSSLISYWRIVQHQYTVKSKADKYYMHSNRKPS